MTRSKFPIICFCAVALASAATAQTPAPSPRDPIPEDASRAILAAFGRYAIVGMEAGHSMKDIDDFILSLIRQPGFPLIVNDIVLECTNSKYQSVLDRYIAGENVSFEQVSRAWRTSGPPCADFHVGVFPLIRRINLRLPTDKRLRVLAGEPPVDFDSITTEAQARNYYGSGRREESMAAVIEREVLVKHRKALVLYGGFHLMHSNRGGNGVALYERKYPGITYVIWVNETGCSGTNAFTRAIESRMADWPVPSVAGIRNTTFAQLDDLSPSPFGRWSESVDAVLYLGPRDLLLKQPVPAYMWLDSSYIRELHRQASVPGAATTRAQEILDERKVVEAEASPFVCEKVTAPGRSP
jgi:hypothetical protein